MMISRTIAFTLATLFATSLNASIVVTTDDKGDNLVEIYDSGKLTTLENDEVTFIYENGKCQFFEHEQQITVKEKCEVLPAKFKEARDKMMAAMGVTEEQLAAMQQSQGGGQADFKLEESGTSTVAGYQVNCLKGSKTHEICYSTDLKKDLDSEVDTSRLQNVFANFADPMGSDAKLEARRKLQAKGYIMKDVDMQIPNSGLMSFLPADQLEKLMKEMEASGAAAVEGEVVVSVERNVSVDYRVPEYREVTIDEFFQLMMMGN